MGSKSEPNSRSGSFKRKTRISVLEEEDKRRSSLPISTEKALSHTRKYPLEEVEEQPQHMALSSEVALDSLFLFKSFIDLSLTLLSRLSPFVAVAIPYNIYCLWLDY
jgi:hypothetical protein